MSPEEYRPEYFMDEDIIFVSMNYRMGTFGSLNYNNMEHQQLLE